MDILSRTIHQNRIHNEVCRPRGGCRPENGRRQTLIGDTPYTFLVCADCGRWIDAKPAQREEPR